MLEINAETRKILRKKVKNLRDKGSIPAVLYGAKVKSTPLKISYNSFKKLYKEAGESTIIKLKIKNYSNDKQSDSNSKEEVKNVLIYDVEKNPVSGKFTHVDFYAVRMDKTITTEVPLVFKGESPAVEVDDGVLVKNIVEVEIEALPINLPHEIEVDISSLKSFDDAIHIKDLSIGEGVKILAEPDEVVASVVPPRSEEELAALEKEVEEVKEVEREGEEEKEVSIAEETEKSEKSDTSSEKLEQKEEK